MSDGLARLVTEASLAKLAGERSYAVNQALVLSNWLIGTHIIEFKQDGEDRSKYGQGLLHQLSADLSARGVKGIGPHMLERMRLFSRHYPQFTESISAPLVRRHINGAASSHRVISAPVVRKSEAHAPAPLASELIPVLPGRIWPTSSVPTILEKRSAKSNALEETGPRGSSSARWGHCFMNARRFPR